MSGRGARRSAPRSPDRSRPESSPTVACHWRTRRALHRRRQPAKDTCRFRCLSIMDGSRCAPARRALPDDSTACRPDLRRLPTCSATCPPCAAALRVRMRPRRAHSPDRRTLSRARSTNSAVRRTLSPPAASGWSGSYQRLLAQPRQTSELIRRRLIPFRPAANPESARCLPCPCPARRCLRLLPGSLRQLASANPPRLPHPRLHRARPGGEAGVARCPAAADPRCSRSRSTSRSTSPAARRPRTAGRPPPADACMLDAGPTLDFSLGERGFRRRHPDRRRQTGPDPLRHHARLHGAGTAAEETPTPFLQPPPPAPWKATPISTCWSRTRSTRWTGTPSRTKLLGRHG